MADQKIYACIDYEDQYVQPLLLNAIKARVPSELLVLVKDASELPSNGCKFLQWRQYESLDFDRLMSGSDSSLSNSYVIRKALIRKHYLSMTVSHWLTKHPESALKRHVKSGVEFEVDFAEFLDEALIEAFELHESWQRNESKEPSEKEWWILKPGMSDRGQGIRLFSSEEELTEIFEEWDPPSDDEEEDEDEAAHSGDEADDSGPKFEDNDDDATGIMTSQLRHFVAQPYIDPPLLMPSDHPSAGRKFHIRTYVLAVGALKVFVYKPMLALFAGKPYAPPSSEETQPDLSAHLTNTCLQTGEREGSVHAFWSLPSTLPNLQTQASDWREDVFKQICDATGQVFEAAARSMSIHFQPLPNAFELFGLDFMVDAAGTTWLMEVNAFPDFAQTGSELQDLVKNLMEDVVDVAIKPFFGVEKGSKSAGDKDGLVEVLNIDLGKN